MLVVLRSMQARSKARGPRFEKLQPIYSSLLVATAGASIHNLVSRKRHFSLSVAVRTISIQLMTSRVARLLTFTALLVPLFVALPYGTSAHDIPTDVTVQMYIRPAGDRLNVIVRVPLKAMRDFEFPERGPGYLDIARVDVPLREAAKQWISDAVEVDEGEARLASARVVEARVSLESDRSFESYEEAMAHVTGSRLPNNT